ncbi:mutator type transposase [Tanacetum coccineum]
MQVSKLPNEDTWEVTCLDGRDKPIITCLEYIREYLMKRIVNVQKVQDKCDGPLTPSTAKIFKLIVRAAAKLKESDVSTTIIPPKPHPQIGRPPKKRKKSAAELADEMMKSKKLTKTGKSVTCKSCKQVGHNSRGCKSKKGEQAGVAGHEDAAHGLQQAGVHGSQTTQSTPQAS